MKRGISALFAALGIYGIGYLSSFVAGSYFNNSLFSGIVFLCVVLSFLKIVDCCEGMEKKKVKKLVFYSAMMALFFALTLVLGYQLKSTGMTECGFVGKGKIVLRTICLGFATFPPFFAIFFHAEKYYSNTYNIIIQEKNKTNSKLLQPKTMFFICWAFIFVCWIPVFLAYYPAIMSFDFHRQSIEATKGFIWFNSHHPLAHTWLIWFFFQIGNAVSSLEVGMAYYSLFQMAVFSAALAISLVVTFRLSQRKWVLFLTALFYALFPFISIFSVIVTKDVLFSAFFVIFVSLLGEKFILGKMKKRRWLDICLVFDGILMILFRNNALYAVVVFGILLVIFIEKKKKISMLVLMLLIVIGGKFALEGIQLAIGTEIRGSGSEKYSVLIQQFARVGYFHGDELDEETWTLLDTYVDNELWDKYYAPLSDPVKAYVAVQNYGQTWKDNMGNVFRAWIKIGLQYPNEYIDAFLGLTCGYWFVDDVTWAEVYEYGREERMGALSSYNATVSEVIPEGIAHESKLPALEYVLEGIASDNVFFDWPVISNLFKPAVYMWGILTLFVLAIYTRQKEKILVILFPLLYLGTMLLGPVVQMRYFMPILLLFPLFVALWLESAKTGKNQ